jgi:HEAT repeat protein
MVKLVVSVCSIMLASCGPDPIQRASDTPWSSKSQSREVMNRAKTGSSTPTLVDKGTVNETALTILQVFLDSPNPRLRANAVESMRFAPPEILERAVQLGLGDENRGVRFVAAMMIGEESLCNISILLEPLLLDESESVQVAAMFSLHKCGEKVDLNPISMMLQSDNAELRGNAAMIIGQLGNPSAIMVIRKALNTTPNSITPIRRRLINLQMAESLILLGERKELEVIRAAVFSSIQESEVTALACQIAGNLRDVEVISTLESITVTPERYPDEIRLVAATSLAQISPSRMPLDVVLRFSSNDSPTIRSQCATALGVQGDSISLGPLALMLKDIDPLVQISAAGAVLRINNKDSLAITH